MIALLGALAGAILGSFLATLVLRWPEKRPVTGRSACDHCGASVQARDLVPILSALWLRGRCRHCDRPIDRTHLHIELTCAAIGGIALLVSPDLEGAALALLGWLLVPLAMLDWRHFWLPDRLTISVAVAGLVVGQYVSNLSLMDRAIGGVFGFLSLWLLGVLFEKLRGKRGLGAGDAKLLAGLGCWVGWQYLPTVLLVAAGSSLAVILATRSYRDAGRRYPFGTALGLAGWLVAAGLVILVR